MFTITLISGSFIAISSYSWMGIWIGLEINLLSIIPLMRNTHNIISSEAALKYFITQALASTLLLFSIIILSINFLYFNLNFYFTLILNTSLLTKMGAAPFHFWFPEVIDGLNWTTAFIILTWQKIAPIVLITYFNQSIQYFVLIIIFRIIISGIIGLNQTSLRKIIAYSSINHIGWIIRTILISEIVWIYYFCIYFFIIFNIVIFFKIFNIFHLKQFFILINHNFLLKFFFILNFLSLGGLPPFLGFLPKWITIQTLIYRNIIILPVIITLITLITLFIYLRITFSSVLLNSNDLAFYTSPPIKINLILIFNFITLISLIFSTILFNFL